MKYRIEAIDNATSQQFRWTDLGINSTFGAAYLYSLEAENDLPNFGDVIWEHDIEEIIRDCRKYGVQAFTISNTFSGLIETIAAFQEQGCTLDGLVKVNSRYPDCRTGERQVIPAFQLSLH